MHRSPLELLAQRAVPPLAQSSLPVLAQRVSLREPPAWELQPAQALPAQVSLPQVPEHVVLPVPLLALGLLASPPLADELAQSEDQQEGPPLVPPAAAKLPLQPPLSPSARLPPRFPRPLHLAGDA